MKQIAFKMYLKPNALEEYKKRHEAIWPKLKALLKEVGITEYFIFHDPETNCLFAFQQTQGEGSQGLSDNHIVQKWWSYMSDLMVTNTDLSPKQTDLNKLFTI